MHLIYFDESGNTGNNLEDPQQPVFVLGALVVLANVPKDEMEDELRVRVPETRTTRVVCRTGDPSSPADLAMVNVGGARSIIVLAGDEGDAGVVKAVLAVRSVDPEFANAHVVAELDNAGHAATLRTLTEGRIVTIQADEIIAELTAQACHQAGLAAVFRELLDFDGDEIYFTSVPELVGVAYRDALLAFSSCSVLGWIRADGVVELNPPADATFGEGYEIITVAEDDDTVVFTGVGSPPPQVTVRRPPSSSGLSPSSRRAAAQGRKASSPSSRPMRAGACDMRSATPAQSSSPVLTIASATTDAAVQAAGGS